MAVKSFRSAQFKKLFSLLPADVQREAIEAFHLWQQNPQHPGLHFKSLQGHPHYWSVRIGIGYRAVSERNGDTIVWFWIGTQQDFGKTF
jgi:hypothetical protein